MRASIIGGFLFRLGIGALPFLLPLLMQVGFGLSPFQSGLVTFASAVGAMGMKTLAARIIRAFGFRNLMTVNAVVSSVFLAACALFTATTPLLLIFDHPRWSAASSARCSSPRSTRSPMPRSSRRR